MLHESRKTVEYVPPPYVCPYYFSWTLLLQIVYNIRRSQQRAVVRKKSVKAASTAAQPCVLACVMLICAGSFAVAAPRPWLRMPPSLISGASKARRRHAVITFPPPFPSPLPRALFAQPGSCLAAQQSGTGGRPSTIVNQGQPLVGQCG